MAAKPIAKTCGPGVVRLGPFRATWAGHIVSWVRGAREAYWLAPRTPPPLTAGKVLEWCSAGHEPLMLIDGETREPLAYGEVNALHASRHEYWLGHLIVSPRHRGRGLGRRLTELLLERAFQTYGARRVSLVVFPQNAAAVKCYLSAGMIQDGYEVHRFGKSRRGVHLLRLAVTRSLFGTRGGTG